MARMPVEIVVIGEVHIDAVEQAIGLANSVQSEFAYQKLEAASSDSFNALAYRRANVSNFMDRIDNTRDELRGFHPFLIAIVDTELEGSNFANLFGSHRGSKGISVVTISKVEGLIIPEGKISSYFIYYFARYTLSFIYSNHKNHEETRGCIFDRKTDKIDLLLSMKSRAICDDCRNALLSQSRKLSPTQLHALDALLRLSGQILEDEEALSKREHTQLSEPQDEGAHTSKDAISQLKIVKVKLDYQAEQRAQVNLWLYVGLLAAIWVLLAILTYIYSWEKMEPWTYFLGGGATIGSFMYFVITRRELSPTTIYRQTVAANKERYYRKYGFDIDTYHRLVA